MKKNKKKQEKQHKQKPQKQWAAKITIPSGKFIFTRGHDPVTDESPHDCRIEEVPFYGDCIPDRINEFAHKGHKIIIDGVPAKKMLKKIATVAERNAYIKSLGL
ncbi:MAG: hypothetical protein ACPGO5_04665 [Patescibacteria group bacterium]